MDDLDKATIINNDGLLSSARGLIWFSGFMFLVLGCAGGYNFGSTEGGDLPGFAWVLVGITFFFTCALFTITNFVVANALVSGKKWSWYGGLGLGVLYIPSCCFPLGALIILGLVRTKVRQAYGITPTPA